MPNPVHDGDRSEVFVDQGGSMTGTAGAVVMANNAFLTTTGCTRTGTPTSARRGPSTSASSAL
jgi:hypothetical protein